MCCSVMWYVALVGADNLELSAARSIVDVLAGRPPAYAVNAPAGTLLEVIEDAEPAPYKNISGGR